MTAILTRPATSARPDQTITRRRAQLLDNGLAYLAPRATYAAVEFDFEDHQGDTVMTVYKADDTVLVVIGYGVENYDVARYDLPEWQNVHGEPTHRENGLTAAKTLATLTDTRDWWDADLPPVA